jgi:AcrR family transcriptional regulator
VAGRREKQKRARERRILKAARGLFGKKGYDQTAMESIAVTAGVAVGTLYNYFPSKPQLLLGIVRRQTEDLVFAGEQALEKLPEDPVLAVTTLIDVYLGVLDELDRSLLRKVFSAALSEPRTTGERVLESDLRLIEQLTSLLDRMRASGLLASRTDPGPAAIVLYGVYFAWFTLFLINAEISVDALRVEVHRGVEIVMRGLMDDPASGGKR